MSTHTSGGALSRRQAVIGSAATTILAIVPTYASTSAVDPHPAWLEEWRAYAERFDDAPYGTDLSPTVAELHRLADLIIDTPAVTPDGMIAKLQAIEEDVLAYLDDNAGPLAVIDQVKQFLGTMT